MNNFSLLKGDLPERSGISKLQQKLAVAISAITMATQLACTNVIDESERQTDLTAIIDENPELAELKSKYPQVFEALKTVELPGLEDQVLEYYQLYQEGNDPDLNQSGAAVEDITGATQLSEQELTQLYAQKAAWVMHIAPRLPWSFAEMPETEIMFDQNSIRHYRGEFFDLVPVNHQEVYKYMQENELIKDTPEETAYAVMNWFRDNVIHLSAEEQESEQFALDTYGHTMAPSTEEILELSNQNKWIRVAGCHGSAKLFKNMMEAVGIAVKHGIIEINEGRHATVELPFLGKALYHADDLHSFHGLTSDGQAIPLQEILVDREKVNSLRVNELFESDPDDVSVAYLEHQFYLAEKFLTDRVLLQYAYYATGKDSVRPFSVDDIGFQLPEDRLNAWYTKVEDELLRIGDGNFNAAFTKLAEINNERYFSKN